MKGRDHFTPSEAARIRGLLGEVRRAEPGPAQKVLRDQLRRSGFYISDWEAGAAGFTASDFDELVQRGMVEIREGSATAKATSATGRQASRASSHATAAHPKASPRGSVVEQAMNALRGRRLQIAEALAGAVPSVPGLYAIHAEPSIWLALGLGEPPDARPLYVGKAEVSLVDRDLKTHFATGTTGRSSPRRSFAALLADELKLVPIPRRPSNPEPRKWTHFALEADGDVRLTDWMCEHLVLACWPSLPGPKLVEIEHAVMRKWLPSLNLIGVTTPWTAEVRGARATLAERAKAWARERDLLTE